MSTDRLHAQLAAADPAARAGAAVATDLAAEAQALLARVQSTPSPSRATPSRALVGALALVAALALGVNAIRLAAPGGVGASDRAGVVLALAAGAVREPAPAGHQWWRVHTATVDEQGGVTPGRTSYLAVDGSRPPVHDDRPSPDGVWSTGMADNDRPGTWQAPNAAFLATLPREVSALRARLDADTAGRGRSVDGEVVVYVADVLRSGVVPPDLRRALYGVLRTVPGVDVVAEHVRVGGRTGTVVAHRDGQQLLLDPDTGALLGEREGSTAWTTINVTVVDDVPAEVRSVLVTHSCSVMEGGGVMCVTPKAPLAPQGVGKPTSGRS